MPDPFYPSVDFVFIENHLRASGKVLDVLEVGKTKTFVLEGNQAIHKRLLVVRQIQPDQVCYEQAVYLAAKFKFIGALLSWYESNRNWKEGAYIV